MSKDREYLQIEREIRRFKKQSYKEQIIILKRETEQILDEWYDMFPYGDIDSSTKVSDLRLADDIFMKFDITDKNMIIKMKNDMNNVSYDELKKEYQRFHTNLRARNHKNKK